MQAEPPQAQPEAAAASSSAAAAGAGAAAETAAAAGAVGAAGTVEARALSRRLKALVNALPVAEGAEEAQLLSLYPAGVDRSKPSEIAALIAALDARQAPRHPVVSTPPCASTRPVVTPPLGARQAESEAGSEARGEAAEARRLAKEADEP